MGPIVGAAIGALVGGGLSAMILAPNWKHVPTGESGGVVVRAVLTGTVIGALIGLFL